MTVEQYCKVKGITLKEYIDRIISKWPRWKRQYAKHPFNDKCYQVKNDNYSYWPGDEE